jgi:hypothetical protein
MPTCGCNVCQKSPDVIVSDITLASTLPKIVASLREQLPLAVSGNSIPL